MPWNGPSFHHHNLGLSDAQSAHAAAIANHVLQSTGDEGEAIATANKLIHHRDDGGGLPAVGYGGIGGMSPATAGMNPMMASMYQQYGSLPVEKLQELNARMGGTPYGQLIRQILQRKLSQPNAQPENQVQMPTMQSLGFGQPQQQARGGIVYRQSGGTLGDQVSRDYGDTLADTLRRSPHNQETTDRYVAARNAEAGALTNEAGLRNQKFFSGRDASLARADYPGFHDGGMHLAFGGGSPLGVPMSMADPWWTRQEAYGAEKTGGFLAGTTPGRADKIETTAPGGAYVVPADVIAGLGDGNSLAGAKFMDMAMKTGPHGIPLERGVRGRGPPRPPAESARMMGIAKGGGVQAGGKESPVALSHGEHVLTPEQIIAHFGDLKRGHRILDHWVIHERKKNIEKLKKLQPPVGADRHMKKAA